VVEGEGACTVVSGEKCPMRHGDVVLTPTWLWHEHRHEGSGPFIWLDVLDMPLVIYLDASYVTPGERQTDTRPPRAYGASGIVPRMKGERTGASHPQLRYDWTRTRSALHDVAQQTARDQLVEVAYVNPETGGDCLTTIGFSALLLRPGEIRALRRMSPACVYHVVDGRGEGEVNGTTMKLERADTFCAPGFATVQLANASSSEPLFIITADESPVHRKLGIFETRD
jgi:gentisate 1,2-dioxygenase